MSQGGEGSVNPLFASVASNPQVQSAVAQSVVQTHMVTVSASDGSLANELGVSIDEMISMKSWASKLRMSMVVISALAIIVAFDNMVSGNSTEGAFLAFYIVIFASLLCCFETRIKTVALYIAVNFGFMYSTKGRIAYLIFVAFVCFIMSTFGKIIFALLLAQGLVFGYVLFKHPKFDGYLKKIQLFGDIPTKDNRTLVSQVEV